MEDKYGHKYERRKDLTLHRRKATYHLNICNDIIGVEGNLVLCHGLVVIQGNGRDASTSSLLLEKIRITWNKFHWRSINTSSSSDSSGGRSYLLAACAACSSCRLLCVSSSCRLLSLSSSCRLLSISSSCRLLSLSSASSLCCSSCSLCFSWCRHVSDI